MNKPFVAICNSYIDIVPGHVHLRELADIAKEAIREAGAIPFEFNTIGVDDGIAMGHIGMRYYYPLEKSLLMLQRPSLMRTGSMAYFTFLIATK